MRFDILKEEWSKGNPRYRRKFGKSLRRHVLVINKAIGSCSSQDQDFQVSSGGTRLPSPTLATWFPSTLTSLDRYWYCHVNVELWISYKWVNFHSCRHVFLTPEKNHWTVYGLGRIRLYYLGTSTFFKNTRHFSSATFIWESSITSCFHLQLYATKTFFFLFCVFLDLIVIISIEENKKNLTLCQNNEKWTKILWILGQYNSRHVIKHVNLKFKNGTFSIKVEYLISSSDHFLKIILLFFQNISE